MCAVQDCIVGPPPVDFASDPVDACRACYPRKSHNDGSVSRSDSYLSLQGLTPGLHGTLTYKYNYDRTHLRFKVDYNHSACLRSRRPRAAGSLPTAMRKQHLARQSRSATSSALLFELTDSSGKHMSLLQLPTTPAGVQCRLTDCHSHVAFSSHKHIGPTRRRKSSWHSHQSQPCFASLAKSFNKRKAEYKSQAAEAKDEASGSLQTAAGWSKHLLCGALSAVVSRTTMAPLERIKLEIVLHKRQETMFEVAMGVLERDGKSGFWKGNGLNLLRTAPYKAVNFFSYDMYRKLLLRLSGNQNKPNRAERFVAGAMAGVTATVTCFPLDVMRTRVMGPGGHQYGGVVSTFRELLQKEGVSSLYVGLLPAMISMAPAGAVFYGVYDLLKERQLRPVRVKNGREPGDTSGGEQLGPLQMLLFGGLSGASAEAVVYPMEVIRRRMQVQAASASSAGVANASQAAMQKIRVNAFQKLGSTVVSLAEEQGLRGFYAGMLPNMLQVLPNAALSYFAYETFKRLLQVPD